MHKPTESLQSILLEHVCSMEYYQTDGIIEPIQVLKDINLEVKQGEIYGIIGASAFELRLLLEIIANARPYQDGRCVLLQRGMMRQKRVILPHLYYIGSTNMLFDNMTTLEYLMFITAKQKGDVVERQQAILQNLLDHDMGFISLSPIHDLSPDERVIVTMMSALYTKSEIIILNLARLQYSEQTLSALEKICATIRKENKTLVFSAFDYSLVERISTHIAALKNGHFLYTGRTKDFIDAWDHLSIVLEDENIKTISDILQKKFETIELHEDGDILEIWDAEHDLKLYQKVFDCLQKNKVYPKKLYQHKNCVENAWKEIQHHDL